MVWIKEGKIRVKSSSNYFLPQNPLFLVVAVSLFVCFSEPFLLVCSLYVFTATAPTPTIAAVSNSFGMNPALQSLEKLDVKDKRMQRNLGIR